MGFMDHRRTWTFRVAATSEECIDAFARAFESKATALINADWSVAKSPRSAVATYHANRGISAMARWSRQARINERMASGSQITFEITGSANGYTECVMQLTRWTTRMLFTQQVGVLRSYMRGVPRRLRELDPAVQVMKA